MISFEELHKKTLPEKKKRAVKIDFVSYYLWRPICDFLSIVLMPTRISPTGVTIFSFYMAVIALIIFLFVPGKIGALIGYLFIWFWNISDGIDGNLARYREQFSKSGDLWDATAGYMAMVSFYFGAGIIASNEVSHFKIDMFDDKAYVIMGAIAAICTIFPRLIVQKKNVVFGDEAVKELKGKADYGFLKKIIMNVNSINGLAGILLLVTIIFKLVNLFIVIYCLIQVIFAIGAMKVTLSKLEN